MITFVTIPKRRERNKMEKIYRQTDRQEKKKRQIGTFKITELKIKKSARKRKGKVWGFQ